MKAIVKEIQVCGGRLYKELYRACLNYLEVVGEGTDREKLHFTIELPDGSVKSITIRQEDDCVVAYGDFEGLPDMLDYATQVQKEWENATND